MKQKRHRRYRRSTRLRGRDYSQPGAYFVTIVSQDRAPVFGQVKNGQLRLSDAGRMVLEWFKKLERRFAHVKCDAVVCMPDHIHFVIFIMDTTRQTTGTIQRSLPDLGDIVGWFKTMTTNEYIRGVKSHGWPSFNGRLWQRNYYDHIVRTHESLTRIRRYIIDNPRRGDPKWSPET